MSCTDQDPFLFSARRKERMGAQCAGNDVWVLTTYNRQKEKAVCHFLESQTALEPVVSAYTTRCTLVLPAQHPGHNAAGWPTSKLCLLLQVMVPISPMGDAHLRYYIYHTPATLSRNFCKKYIFLLFPMRVKLCNSTSKVQKTQKYNILWYILHKKTRCW